MNTSIYKGFSMAMLNNQMVIIYYGKYHHYGNVTIMNYGRSPHIGQLWKITMELYISMDMYNVYNQLEMHITMTSMENNYGHVYDYLWICI